MTSLKYIATAVLLSGLIGCQSLEEEPFGFLTPENFFESESDFEAFMLGVYQIGTLQVYYGENVYHDCLSDEYDIDPLNVRPFRFAFNEYTHTPNDYRDDVLYLSSYTILNSTNTLLRQVENSELTEPLARQYAGEARFMRALVAFSLVRTFGDIVYYTERIENPSQGSSFPRMSAELVYEQIVADLNFAKDNLPDSWGLVRSRASRASALALLAQVHLTLATYNDIYRGAYDYRSIDERLIDALAGDFGNHWAAASSYALEVIDNRDRYEVELVEDMQDLFNGEIGDTREHIFSINYEGQLKGSGGPGTTGPGGIEGWRNNNNGLMPMRNPTVVGGWNTFVPPMSLYNSFIPGDYRREVSFNTEWYQLSAPVNGDTLATFRMSDLSGTRSAYSAKWTRLPGFTEGWPTGVATSHNQPVLRLGELILIAAEALNEQGQTERAIELVNELRKRARGGTSGTESREVPADVPTGLAQDDAWDVIWQERTYELVFEFERWHDLVRRDSMEAVMSRFTPLRTGEPLGSNVQDYHILLPIPQVEIDKTGMQQNRGY
jgi:hypothetical protein